MKISLTSRQIRILLISGIWAAFSFVLLLTAMGIAQGAEPAVDFLHQAYFAWIYGPGLQRLLKLLMGLGLLGLGILGFRNFTFRFPVLVSALLFTLNILIHISPAGRLSPLGIPGVPTLTNLALWICFTGNFYLAILLFCGLEGRPLPQRTETKIRGRDRLLYAGILLLGWLPMLVSLAPGMIYVDSSCQILEYQGYRIMNASNPLLLTFLYGALFTWGQALFNDDAGLFACVLVQTILLLAALTEGCMEIGSATGSRKRAILAALFFALLPNYPSMAVIVIKDSVYAAVFLLFLVFYLRFLRLGRKKDLVGLLVLSVLCALTRKNAVYISIACLLVLALRKSRFRAVLISGAAVLFLGNVFLDSVVYPAFGVEIRPLMRREKYSFVFQHTGYYCTKHSEELTQEEIDIINAVLDFDKICKEYSPDISDPVKNTYHAQDQQAMRQYLLLSAKLFLRHPVTGLESILYSKNLYFDPLAPGSRPLWLIRGDHFSETYGREVIFGYWFGEDRATDFQIYLSRLEKFLPVQLFAGCGSFTWLALCLLAAGWVQKNKLQLLAAFPTTVTTLGLLVTHMNGAVRYGSPLLVSVPILLLLFRVYSEAERPQEKSAAGDPAVT